MVCRSCWALVLAFCLSGCFSISKAARDSDEEEWGARWGDDDVRSGNNPEEKKYAGEEKPAAAGPPPRTQEPADTEKPAAEVASVDSAENKTPAGPAEPEPGPVPSEEPREQPPEPSEEPAAQPSVEEPPGAGGKPVEPRAPVVLYPPEENENSDGDESKEAPVKEPAVGKDGPPERPVVVSTATADPVASEPWVFIDAAGGIYLTQKGRVHPGVGLSVGINLGKALGWRGLYVAVDNDIIIAEHQLGTSEYVILDTQLGFKGRFLLGPVRLLAGLGFALRNAFVTSYTDEKPSASLGLGVVFAAGLEVPVWGPLGVMLRGDGRYVKDPFRERFVFSSMIVGGVNFTF